MAIDPKPAVYLSSLSLDGRRGSLVSRDRGDAQGRAPAVQGYILWGSVQSRAKGKGTAGDNDVQGKPHRGPALQMQRP